MEDHLKKKLKDNLSLFFNKYYKQTMQNEELDYTHMNTILDYLTIDILIMYENNIKEHFVEYWIRSADIDGNMWEVRGNCSRRICSPTELNSLPSNTDVVQDMNQNNSILHDNSYHTGFEIGKVLQNKTYQEVIEEGRNNPNCKGVTYNNRRGCGWLHEQIIPNKIINANNPETPHTHRHNWHTLCIFPDRP